MNTTQLLRDFQELNLPFKADIVIVGDGSGSTAERSCGFCAVSWDTTTNELKQFHGGLSTGTVNVAELSAFLLPLRYYFSPKPVQQKRTILCVTDSEVTARCAKGEYCRSQNLDLWAQYDFLTKNFKMYWYEVKRNTNQLSVYCDSVSKQNRLLFGEDK